MIKTLKLKNFTVFEDVEFHFGEGLNIIHGTNGSGKSHILKLCYVLQHALQRQDSSSSVERPSKVVLQRAIATELKEVFRPDELGRLTTRQRGSSSTEVVASFYNEAEPLSFTFSSRSTAEVKIDSLPQSWLERAPVFLPAREVLTIYPGFVSLYENHAINFDRTWRDLCLLLGAPLARGTKAAKIQTLLTPIEAAMEGKVILDSSGRFYLERSEPAGKIEMHLVAEGLRKLAMVARLIATGSLADKGCLFWDEPEANLNPVIIKKVAEVLLGFATQHIQTIIATHSLFLLRELEILSEDQRDLHYFGLHPHEQGRAMVLQGLNIADTGDIAALDESLAQSERYMRLGTY